MLKTCLNIFRIFYLIIKYFSLIFYFFIEPGTQKKSDKGDPVKKKR
jgi:hypothetical protein